MQVITMLKQKILCPNFSQKKAVLQNYLTQHNIPFSATDTKKVLYEKIKQKKTSVVYKTDKIANLHGHINSIGLSSVSNGGSYYNPRSTLNLIR